MFLNRKVELEELERIWRRSKAGFVVLYGRRRVGKSSLLKHFSKGRQVFYWTATKTTDKKLLQSFSREFHLFRNPTASIPDEFSYPNWESALMAIADNVRKNKIMVVFDEFPYAIDAVPELPSLLQKIWDDELKNSRIVLFVTGSRIGMVESHILSSKGPLYGRATDVIWLDPFPLNALHQFLPKYSKSQLVEVYSITGGVPLYIEIFDDSVCVLENLKREVLSKSSMLKAEPYFLIHEELKEPMRYAAILQELSGGKNTQAEVAKAIGVAPSHVIPYLHTLERLRYMGRHIPVTEERKSSRKSRYVLSDLFLKFYFRFIAPRMNLIEEGREALLFEEISKNWDSFVGKSGFEEICRLWCIDQAKKSHLSFEPDVIGKFWDSSVEVDIAMISKKHRSMIIGECKWTRKQCDISVLNDLNRKAAYLKKKFGYHINMMIFSKSDFADGLMERAKIENVKLIGLNEMI